MIKESQPISMAEASEYIKKDATELIGFIKNFTKITPAKAKNLKKKLEDLDLMKLGGKQIAKIIDLLPSEAEELNKIFTDMGLDEDETKKILETIKEHK